jgi:hypothetical protein
VYEASSSRKKERPNFLPKEHLAQYGGNLEDCHIGPQETEIKQNSVLASAL